MKSIKCKNCGLSNFELDAECRRCGHWLSHSANVSAAPATKRPGRFSLASLLVYVLVAAGGYYLYISMQRSIMDVNAADAYRVGTQPPQRAQPAGLSRNEQDRQHANQVGKTIKENPSSVEQRKHNEETQELIQEASR